MTINYDRLKAYRPDPIPASYGARDCILYALSIGIGMDPTDEDQLRFVDESRLQAFPTMTTMLGWMGRLTDPEFGIDNRKVVASDLSMQLHAPLPATQAGLSGHGRVREVYDKGPGGHAIVQFTRDLVAADGTRLATIDNSIIARGQGGFGGPANAPEAAPVPETPPDKICDLPTPPNLALLFRMHGDTNPLHISPAFAQRVGFPRPILHGAAVFGVAAHALVRSLAGYDGARLAAMSARFVKPVFPGDVVRTQMWSSGGEVRFNALVAERGEIVLGNGTATITA